MGGEWREVLLEDLAAPTKNALVGGPFGSDLVASDYSSTGTPVIRGENLSVGRWVGGQFVFVTAVKAASLAANTAGPLDIVFTQRGVNHYRQVAVVPPNVTQRFVISQSQMKLTVDPEKADPLFVYYAFRDPCQQQYLQQHAIQTGVPHTNLSILRKAPIRIPSLDLQRSISRVLGTLDDKIELNQRMSETLEALGRALFKSWFVDFDPVRAKVKGRAPVLPERISRLFSDRLGDSELGDLPDGWRIQSLRDLLAESNERVGSSDVPEYSSTNEGLQPRSRIFKKRLAVSSDKNKLVRRGYLVFGLSREVLNFGLMHDELGSVSGAYRVFRVDDAQIVPDLLERIMRIKSAYYYNAVSASSREGQSVSADSVGVLEVVVPPMNLQLAWYEVTSAIADRLRNLSDESRTLAAMRDAVLPKLLSGELRIRQAERSVAQANV